MIFQPTDRELLRKQQSTCSCFRTRRRRRAKAGRAHYHHPSRRLRGASSRRTSRRAWRARGRTSASGGRTSSSPGSAGPPSHRWPGTYANVGRIAQPVCVCVCVLGRFRRLSNNSSTGLGGPVQIKIKWFYDSMSFSQHVSW